VNTSQHTTSSEGAIAPSLLDYLQVLGRRKVLVVATLLLVPVTAVAFSLRQTPVYQASAEVLLTHQNIRDAITGGTPPYIDPARDAQTQAELARGQQVLARVIEAVPVANLTQAELMKSSSVSPTLGSDLLTFSVKNSNPALAKRLATAYANAFVGYQRVQDVRSIETALAGVKDQLVQLEVADAKKTPSYKALVATQNQLTALAAAPPQSMKVASPADEAPKVAPRTVRNGLLAVCLGVIFALVVAFLSDALDTRVRSVDTIREVLGLRLLGRLAAPPARLAKSNGLVMLAEPASHDAEPFRILRASFDFANAEYGSRTVMFTSASDGEGKTTTVANLAVALARAGKRVILIDADLRRPSLHRVFDLDERPGLTDVELGEAKLAAALQSMDVTDPTSPHGSGALQVLPAGSQLHDPDELGAERAVGRIIEKVQNQVDLVLVDAAPLLVGDAIALSAYVDAVVVVARLKALRRSTLEDLNGILDTSPAVKLGFILTGAEKSEGYGRYSGHAAAQLRSGRVLHLKTSSSATSRPATEDGADESPLRQGEDAAEAPGGVIDIDRGEVATNGDSEVSRHVREWTETKES
jgi:capsular exopolysaccharide synthesis family protein